ncbi:MAG: sulfotransferase [Bacteroidetes bacterium]|nr:MAG: sulfotransferase [Bacteroidota bacterium]
MLRNMFRSYFSIVSTFHKPFAPLFTYSGLLFLRLIVNVGMILDNLFYPSLSGKKINNPVFIVGNPRSGTTFLQRFLVNQKIGVGMQLWKMLFPSLTLQFIFKPFVTLMEKISPARFHSHAAHETNLRAIETDDPSLLFHFFDDFFVYGFFLAWAKEDLSTYFDPNIRDTSKRDFKWFEKIWKRNLISENHEQIIGKLFSLGVRLPKFLEYFPDAKILYTLRDPLETVPSGLSLVTGVLDGRFGFWKLPKNKRDFYIERLYSALLELSTRFHDDYVNGKFPKEKIKIVRYDRMMNEFEIEMHEILNFINVYESAELLNKINSTAEKQRSHKSGHKYSLEQFGLTEERIRNDYSNIYNTFLN